MSAVGNQGESRSGKAANRPCRNELALRNPGRVLTARGQSWQKKLCTILTAGHDEVTFVKGGVNSVQSAVDVGERGPAGGHAGDRAAGQVNQAFDRRSERGITGQGLNHSR